MWLKVVALLVAEIFCIEQGAMAAPSDRSIFSTKRANYQAIRERALKQLDDKRTLHQGSPQDAARASHKERDPGPVALADLDELSAIQIPPEFGQVLEAWEPETVASRQAQGTSEHDPRLSTSDKPTVILLQDLHAHPQAQRAEASIIEALHKHHGVRLVASEGASSLVDVSFAQAVPRSDRLRRQVADAFLDVGELTGEEHLTITTRLPLTLQGIEDRSLYEQNLQAFRDVLAFSETSQSVIDDIERQFNALKPALYTDAMLRLDGERRRFERGDMALLDYGRLLLREAAGAGLDAATAAPNLTALEAAGTLEAQIDRRALQHETEALVKRLADGAAGASAGSPAETSSVAVERLSDQMRNRRISSATYYAELAELAAMAQARGSPDSSPQVERFARYLALNRQVDASRLHPELDTLFDSAMVSMAGSEAARGLVAQLRSIQLLAAAFRLGLTPEQLSAFRGRRETLRARGFGEFLTAQSQRGVPAHAEEAIDRRFSAIDRFYDIAEARDRVLIENALARAQGRRIGDALVLVAGGFHTAGITRMLREREVPYVVVSPTAADDMDEGRYHRLVMGERASPDEVLSVIRANAQASLFRQDAQAVRIPWKFDDPGGLASWGQISARNLMTAAVEALAPGAALTDPAVQRSLAEQLTNGMAARGVEVASVVFRGDGGSLAMTLTHHDRSVDVEIPLSLREGRNEDLRETPELAAPELKAGGDVEEAAETLRAHQGDGRPRGREALSAAWGVIRVWLFGNREGLFRGGRLVMIAAFGGVALLFGLELLQGGSDVVLGVVSVGRAGGALKRVPAPAVKRADKGSVRTRGAPNETVSLKAGGGALWELGLVSRRDHDDRHNEWAIRPELEQIVQLIRARFGREAVEEMIAPDFWGEELTWSNLRKAVIAYGTATKSSGGRKQLDLGGGRLLRLESDGVLTIISPHFKADHAGRGMQQVFARSEAQAVHELRELRLWTQFGIDQGFIPQQDVEAVRRGTVTWKTFDPTWFYRALLVWMLEDPGHQVLAEIKDGDFHRTGRREEKMSAAGVREYRLPNGILVRTPIGEKDFAAIVSGDARRAINMLPDGSVERVRREDAPMINGLMSDIPLLPQKSQRAIVRGAADASVQEELGVDLVDEIAKRAQRHPHRTITVVDWGLGGGSALIKLGQLLHERGVTNVRLVGFSAEYGEWAKLKHVPPNVEIILDSHLRLSNYFAEGEIDILYSHLALSLFANVGVEFGLRSSLGRRPGDSPEEVLDRAIAHLKEMQKFGAHVRAHLEELLPMIRPMGKVYFDLTESYAADKILLEPLKGYHLDWKVRVFGQGPVHLLRMPDSSVDGPLPDIARNPINVPGHIISSAGGKAAETHGRLSESPRQSRRELLFAGGAVALLLAAFLLQGDMDGALAMATAGSGMSPKLEAGVSQDAWKQHRSLGRWKAPTLDPFQRKWLWGAVAVLVWGVPGPWLAWMGDASILAREIVCMVAAGLWWRAYGAARSHEWRLIAELELENSWVKSTVFPTADVSRLEAEQQAVREYREQFSKEPTTEAARTWILQQTNELLERGFKRGRDLSREEMLVGLRLGMFRVKEGPIVEQVLLRQTVEEAPVEEEKLIWLSVHDGVTLKEITQLQHEVEEDYDASPEFWMGRAKGAVKRLLDSAWTEQAGLLDSVVQEQLRNLLVLFDKVRGKTDGDKLFKPEDWNWYFALAMLVGDRTQEEQVRAAMSPEAKKFLEIPPPLRTRIERWVSRSMIVSEQELELVTPSQSDWRIAGVVRSALEGADALQARIRQVLDREEQTWKEKCKPKGWSAEFPTPGQTQTLMGAVVDQGRRPIWLLVRVTVDHLMIAKEFVTGLEEDRTSRRQSFYAVVGRMRDDQFGVRKAWEDVETGAAEGGAAGRRTAWSEIKLPVYTDNGEFLGRAILPEGSRMVLFSEDPNVFRVRDEIEQSDGVRRGPGNPGGGLGGLLLGSVFGALAGLVVVGAAWWLFDGGDWLTAASQMAEGFDVRPDGALGAVFFGNGGRYFRLRPHEWSEAALVRGDGESLLQAHARQAPNGERYIIPAEQYPHQWLWDTYFHVVSLLGAGEVDAAKDEVRRILRHQWSDGFLAHIIYTEGQHYSPGPGDWGVSGHPTSRITQPPLIVSTVLEIYRYLERHGRREDGLAFLKETVEGRSVYLRLTDYIQWLQTHRTVPGKKLFEVVHPWECGEDNNPAFEALRDTMLADMPQERKEELERRFPRKDFRLVQAEERPTREDYLMYLDLMDRMAGDGRDWGKARERFAVSTPLFNAIGIRAVRDLSAIAELVGDRGRAGMMAQWADEAAQAMREELWDERDGFFYVKDTRTDQLIRMKGAGAFVAWFAGVPTARHTRRLLEHLRDTTSFNAEFGLPSTAMNEKQFFDQKRYWKGPAWMLVEWLVIQGLFEAGEYGAAGEVAQKVVRANGHPEYRNVYTGESLGAKAFSGSAVKELAEAYTPDRLAAWKRAHWGAIGVSAAVRSFSAVRWRRWISGSLMIGLSVLLVAIAGDGAADLAISGAMIPVGAMPGMAGSPAVGGQNGFLQRFQQGREDIASQLRAASYAEETIAQALQLAEELIKEDAILEEDRSIRSLDVSPMTPQELVTWIAHKIERKEDGALDGPNRPKFLFVANHPESGNRQIFYIPLGRASNGSFGWLHMALVRGMSDHDRNASRPSSESLGRLMEYLNLPSGRRVARAVMRTVRNGRLLKKDRDDGHPIVAIHPNGQKPLLHHDRLLSVGLHQGGGIGLVIMNSYGDYMRERLQEVVAQAGAVGLNGMRLLPGQAEEIGVLVESGKDAYVYSGENGRNGVRVVPVERGSRPDAEGLLLRCVAGEGPGKMLIEFADGRLLGEIDYFPTDNMDDIRSGPRRRLPLAVTEAVEEVIAVAHAQYQSSSGLAADPDARLNTIAQAITDPELAAGSVAVLARFPELRSRILDQISTKVAAQKVDGRKDEDFITFYREHLKKLLPMIGLSLLLVAIAGDGAVDLAISGAMMPVGAMSGGAGGASTAERLQRVRASLSGGSTGETSALDRAMAELNLALIERPVDGGAVCDAAMTWSVEERKAFMASADRTGAFRALLTGLLAEMHVERGELEKVVGRTLPGASDVQEGKVLAHKIDALAMSMRGVASALGLKGLVEVCYTFSTEIGRDLMLEAQEESGAAHPVSTIDTMMTPFKAIATQGILYMGILRHGIQDINTTPRKDGLLEAERAAAVLAVCRAGTAARPRQEAARPEPPQRAVAAFVEELRADGRRAAAPLPEELLSIRPSEYRAGGFVRGDLVGTSYEMTYYTGWVAASKKVLDEIAGRFGMSAQDFGFDRLEQMMQSLYWARDESGRLLLRDLPEIELYRLAYRDLPQRLIPELIDGVALSRISGGGEKLRTELANPFHPENDEGNRLMREAIGVLAKTRAQEFLDDPAQLRENPDALIPWIKLMLAANLVDYSHPHILAEIAKAEGKNPAERLVTYVLQRVNDELLPQLGGDGYLRQFVRDIAQGNVHLVQMPDNNTQLAASLKLAEIALAINPDLEIDMILKADNGVMNDASIEDARRLLDGDEAGVYAQLKTYMGAGGERVRFRMIPGAASHGTPLDQLPAEAIEAIRKADVILSEGEANAFILNGLKKRMYLGWRLKWDFGTEACAGIKYTDDIKARKPPVFVRIDGERGPYFQNPLALPDRPARQTILDTLREQAIGRIPAVLDAVVPFDGNSSASAGEIAGRGAQREIAGDVAVLNASPNQETIERRLETEEAKQPNLAGNAWWRTHRREVYKALGMVFVLVVAVSVSAMTGQSTEAGGATVFVGASAIPGSWEWAVEEVKRRPPGRGFTVELRGERWAVIPQPEWPSWDTQGAFVQQREGTPKGESRAGRAMEYVDARDRLARGEAAREVWAAAEQSGRLPQVERIMVLGGSSDFSEASGLLQRCPLATALTVIDWDQENVLRLIRDDRQRLEAAAKRGVTVTVHCGDFRTMPRHVLAREPADLFYTQGVLLSPNAGGVARLNSMFARAMGLVSRGGLFIGTFQVDGEDLPERFHQEFEERYRSFDAWGPARWFVGVKRPAPERTRPDIGGQVTGLIARVNELASAEAPVDPEQWLDAFAALEPVLQNELEARQALGEALQAIAPERLSLVASAVTRRALQGSGELRDWRMSLMILYAVEARQGLQRLEAVSTGRGRSGGANVRQEVLFEVFLVSGNLRDTASSLRPSTVAAIMAEVVEELLLARRRTATDDEAPEIARREAEGFAAAFDAVEAQIYEPAGEAWVRHAVWRLNRRLEELRPGAISLELYDACLQPSHSWRDVARGALVREVERAYREGGEQSARRDSFETVRDRALDAFDAFMEGIDPSAVTTDEMDDLVHSLVEWSAPQPGGSARDRAGALGNDPGIRVVRSPDGLLLGVLGVAADGYVRRALDPQGHEIWSRGDSEEDVSADYLEGQLIRRHEENRLRRQVCARVERRLCETFEASSQPWKAGRVREILQALLQGHDTFGTQLLALAGLGQSPRERELIQQETEALRLPEQPELWEPLVTLAAGQGDRQALVEGLRQELARGNYSPGIVAAAIRLAPELAVGVLPASAEMLDGREGSSRPPAGTDGMNGAATGMADGASGRLSIGPGDHQEPVTRETAVGALITGIVRALPAAQNAEAIRHAIVENDRRAGAARQFLEAQGGMSAQQLRAEFEQQEQESPLTRDPELRAKWRRLRTSTLVLLGLTVLLIAVNLDALSDGQAGYQGVLDWLQGGEGTSAAKDVAATTMVAKPRNKHRQAGPRTPGDLAPDGWPPAIFWAEGRGAVLLVGGNQRILLTPRIAGVLARQAFETAVERWGTGARRGEHLVPVDDMPPGLRTLLEKGKTEEELRRAIWEYRRDPLLEHLVPALFAAKPLLPQAIPDVLTGEPTIQIPGEETDETVPVDDALRTRAARLLWALWDVEPPFGTLTYNEFRIPGEHVDALSLLVGADVGKSGLTFDELVSGMNAERNAQRPALRGLLNLIIRQAVARGCSAEWVAECLTGTGRFAEESGARDELSMLLRKGREAWADGVVASLAVRPGRPARREVGRISAQVVDLRAEPDGRSSPRLQSPETRDWNQEGQASIGASVTSAAGQEAGQPNGSVNVRVGGLLHLEGGQWAHYSVWVDKADVQLVNADEGAAENQAQAGTLVATSKHVRVLVEPRVDAPEVVTVSLGARLVEEIEGGSSPTPAGWRRVRLPNGALGYVQQEGVAPTQELSALPEATRRRRVLELASQFEGDPYHWGGTTSALPDQIEEPGKPFRSGDCSGLALLCHGAVGITIPRNSGDQLALSRRVDPKNLQIGDLVFLSRPDDPTRIWHVMIYAGDGQVIEATMESMSVRKISLTDKLGHPLEQIIPGQPLVGGSHAGECVYFGTYMDWKTEAVRNDAGEVLGVAQFTDDGARAIVSDLQGRALFVLAPDPSNARGGAPVRVRGQVPIGVDEADPPRVKALLSAVLPKMLASAPEGAPLQAEGRKAVRFGVIDGDDSTTIQNMEDLSPELSDADFPWDAVLDEAAAMKRQDLETLKEMALAVRSTAGKLDGALALGDLETWPFPGGVRLELDGERVPERFGRFIHMMQRDASPEELEVLLTVMDYVFWGLREHAWINRDDMVNNIRKHRGEIVTASFERKKEILRETLIEASEWAAPELVDGLMIRIDAEINEIKLDMLFDLIEWAFQGYAESGGQFDMAAKGGRDSAIETYFVFRGKRARARDTGDRKKDSKQLLINTAHETLRLVKAKAPLSLWRHAVLEWAIARGILFGEPIPPEALGIPTARHLEELPKLARQYFGRVLDEVDPRSMNFLAHFLAVHDLGKLLLGNPGHPERSAELLDRLLAQGYGNFSPKEGALMRAMVAFHGKLFWLDNIDVQREFEQMVEGLVRDFDVTNEDLQVAMRAMALFNIAEMAHSEHFGVIDDEVMLDLREKFNNAQAAIARAFARYDGLAAMAPGPEASDAYTWQRVRAPSAGAGMLTIRTSPERDGAVTGMSAQDMTVADDGETRSASGKLFTFTKTCQVSTSMYVHEDAPGTDLWRFSFKQNNPYGKPYIERPGLQPMAIAEKGGDRTVMVVGAPHPQWVQPNTLVILENGEVIVPTVNKANQAGFEPLSGVFTVAIPDQRRFVNVELEVMNGKSVIKAVRPIGGGEAEEWPTGHVGFIAQPLVLNGEDQPLRAPSRENPGGGKRWADGNEVDHDFLQTPTGEWVAYDPNKTLGGYSVIGFKDDGTMGICVLTGSMGILAGDAAAAMKAQGFTWVALIGGSADARAAWKEGDGQWRQTNSFERPKAVAGEVEHGPGNPERVLMSALTILVNTEGPKTASDGGLTRTAESGEHQPAQGEMLVERMSAVPQAAPSATLPAPRAPEFGASPLLREQAEASRDLSGESREPSDRRVKRVAAVAAGSDGSSDARQALQSAGNAALVMTYEQFKQWTDQAQLMPMAVKGFMLRLYRELGIGKVVVVVEQAESAEMAEASAFGVEAVSWGTANMAIRQGTWSPIFVGDGGLLQQRLRLSIIPELLFELAPEALDRIFSRIGERFGVGPGRIDAEAIRRLLAAQRNA